MKAESTPVDRTNPTMIPRAIAPPHPMAMDSFIAQRLISQSLGRGGDYADVFNEYRRDRMVSVRNGILDNATESTGRGVALRVQAGEATGHAFCETDEEGELLATAKLAAQIARDTAGGNGANPARAHWEATKATRGFYPTRQPIAQASISARVAFLKQAVLHAERLDSRLTSVQATLVDTERWIQIFGSDGACVIDYQPTIAILFRAMLREGNREESGFASYASRAGMEFLSSRAIESVATEAVERAQFNFTADLCPAGEMPVVTAPGGAGILVHEAVGHGLEGDFNRKGISSFSGRIGEMVAAQHCSIIDDGTVPLNPGALNVDDEGTIGQRNVLIENGRLIGYMQDKLNARLMGVKGTGSGRRQSYKHPVLPRMRVTSMANGPHDPGEIIASVKKGLYAKTFGVGNVDIVRGDYNFEVMEAYLIENGKLGRPVRGATLVGNGRETLRTVSMVGSDMKYATPAVLCGKKGQTVPVGFGTPTMKVDRLVVGGVT